MTLQCSTCGYRSSDDAFFRKVGGVGASGPRVYCPLCGPERSRRRKLRPLTFGVGYMAVSLILWAIDPDQGTLPPFVFAVLAGISFSGLLTVAAHETGHALAALLVGYRVRSVAIGFGRPLWTFQIGSARISVAKTVQSGWVLAHPVGRTSKYRWATILVSGAAANFAFGAALLAAAVAVGDTGASSAHLWSGLLVGAVLSQVFTGCLSLTPRLTTVNGLRLPSDGKQLLALPFSETFGQDVHLQSALMSAYEALARRNWTEFLAALESEPELRGRPDAMANMLYGIGMTRGPKSALDYYLSHSASLQSDGPEDDLHLAYLWNNAAWYAVLAKGPENLALADELSAKALQRLPDVPSMKGTRGAVLMALGRRQEGEDLLLGAARDHSDLHAKSRLAEFLGDFEERQGNASRAREFKSLQTHLAAA